MGYLQPCGSVVESTIMFSMLLKLACDFIVDPYLDPQKRIILVLFQSIYVLVVEAKLVL